MKKNRPAVFLDRDGVLIHDGGYVHKTEDVHLFDDVPSSLKKLHEQGYYLIVVTNQSGVARGYFSLEDVDLCHQEISQQLLKSDVNIDLYLTCPHHPKGTVEEFAKTCDCRKPEPGMIDQALERLGIDLDSSFIIGDKVSDIDCGGNRGIKGIQIDRGQYPVHSSPALLAKSFKEAADFILATQGAN